MTDLVIFAGPVVIKPAFESIPWKTEVQLVPIVGSGSSHFSDLGASLRDSSGRVLPALLRRYCRAERTDYGRVALAAYSAGWGLLNQVFRNEADRRAVDAAIATDAAFGSNLTGYADYAADAINGRCLMVGTSSNNQANPAAGIYRTARETWLEIQDAAAARSRCYCLAQRVPARRPLPVPSGGAWRTGSCLYWYDYVAPASPPNAGNDFSHAEHHDLAPLAWEAFLVPLFAADWKRQVGIGLAALGSWWAYRYWRR